MIPHPGEYTLRVYSGGGRVDVRAKFQVIEDPASEPLQDAPEHMHAFWAELQKKHPDIKIPAPR